MCSDLSGLVYSLRVVAEDPHDPVYVVDALEAVGEGSYRTVERRVSAGIFGRLIEELRPFLTYRERDYMAFDIDAQAAARAEAARTARVPMERDVRYLNIPSWVLRKVDAEFAALRGR